MNSKASLVEGTIVHLATTNSYRIELECVSPGDVIFRFWVDDKVYGQMPFDNLVKAATRLDPDYASGPERQIQQLRQELAEARGDMYDWQATAMNLDAELKRRKT